MSALQILILFFFSSISLSLFANDYVAEVHALNSDAKSSPLFRIEFKKTLLTNGNETLVAKSLQGNELVLLETAVINPKNAQISEYSVDNRQTGETGQLIFAPDSIWIEYTVKGKAPIKKQIPKSNDIVAPANFERFLQVHFEKLKKEKSMKVDFLIWDRHESIKFKITYLGEMTVGSEKHQHFKMNISNPLIAAFITPIQIWYSNDMKQIRRYLGRVSLQTKAAEGKLVALDADVRYKYKSDTN